MPSPQNVPPLAKYFASTEKKTRDKAVKNLATFLSEAPEHALSNPEMDKLWKGIFYCFWMSDKPLVQQALASELAELLMVITSTTAAMAFLRGFWTTMVREWNGIDRLRIDKYYMLVRRFVNASFRLLIRTSWEKDACSVYNDILASKGGPLCPTDTRIPMSLTSHISDIYLEELDNAIAKTTSEQNPQPAPLGILLSPFFSFMAQTQNSSNYKRVQSSLLEPLLHALTASPQSNDEPSPKRARRDPDLYSNLVPNACLDDPQAGRLGTTVLKKKLLKMVFEVASRPETKDASRRKMYAMWKDGAEDEEEDE